MLTPAFLPEVRRRIMSLQRDDILTHDEYRVASGFFGPIMRPLKPDGSMLLWGGRSGLEALLAIRANPATKLYVIEPDPDRRQLMDRATSGRAVVFSSLREAFSGGLPASLDFVRIDLDCFDAAESRMLIHRRKVGHLCGEIDDKWVDPLQFFRLCRTQVGSFHMFLTRARHTIAGEPESHPYDVSVVVPAYGVEKYIGQCLESLAAQSMERLEVIVVNDGSTDRSGEIAETWARQHPGRIRVVQKANGGCASARMAGLASAQGEYVGFVDADDWVDVRMFEELYRAAVLRGADIGQCGFYEAYEDGTRTEHSTAWGGDGPGGSRGLVRDTSEYLTLMPSIWRRIYKREFLRRANVEFPVHIRRHDDLAFAFPSLALARGVAIVPECYYAYRLGRPGQDVEATDERLFVHFEIFAWLYERVRPWANAHIMRKLAEVECGTHRWVLGRIDKRLCYDYLRQAVKGVRQRYPSQSVGLRRLVATCARRMVTWKRDDRSGASKQEAA